MASNAVRYKFQNIHEVSREVIECRGEEGVDRLVRCGVHTTYVSTPKHGRETEND